MTARTISGTVATLVTLDPAGDDPATIAAGALLEAGLYGAGLARSVTNQGIVQGGTAIALAVGSYILNTRLIQGGSLGVSIYGTGAGMVTNAGTILATASGGFGVALASGGTITNLSGGTIDGGLYAVDSSNQATLFNQGLVGGSVEIGVGFASGKVSNAATGTIEGARSGVRLFGGGSVTNAGTISSPFDSVHFYPGAAGHLTVDPGALFDGLVDGGNTIGASFVSTLELASGSGAAGTLTSLGSHYIDFGQVTIDAGAVWTLASDAIGYGYGVTDNGTLTNTGSLGSGLTLGGGAVLTNAASGAIGVYVYTSYAATFTAVFAVVSEAGTSPATVVNYGRIAAKNTGYGYGIAIDLQTGGSVINGLGGSIYAYGQFPVSITGGPGTVVNDGLISAPSGGAFTQPVYLGDGGSVTNQTGATISGVEIWGAPGSVTNAGTSGGIYLQKGGLVTNQQGATATGVSVQGAAVSATVVNDGTLRSIDVYGGSASVTNQSDGRINSNYYGVSLQLAQETLTNQSGGTITGTLAGVYVSDGSVTNQTGGVISGASQGVFSGLNGAAGAFSTVDNAGTILATARDFIGQGTGNGVALDHAGLVINRAGGTISGTQYGVSLQLAQETLTNQSGGTITGTLAGVYVSDGSVTNQTGGVISGSSHGVFSGLNGAAGAFSTVDNAGTILATARNFFSGQDTGNGVALDHAGLVINRAGGTISGTQYGVLFSGSLGSTLVNYGTISGSGLSVDLTGNTNNRLIVGAGAVFLGGAVDGYGGILEVASAELLSGLGTTIFGFNQLTVDAGGSIALASSVGFNTVVANGSIDIADGASLGAFDALGGTGGVTIESGGGLYDYGTAAASETVSFASPGGYLRVANSSVFASEIDGFGVGSTIDLSTLAFVSGATASIAGGVLTVSSGGTVDTLNVAGLADGTMFSTAADPNTTGTEIGVLCFCAGTRIATSSGEVPVERLRVGDHVRTAGGAVRPIVWIGEGRVKATRGRRTAATPVILRKGALADNVPYQDLRVTKGHAFLLDGVLIPAEFLVNNRSITWDDRAQEVALYHVELGSHDVLLANGAPAESYRDDGNRWLFRNANTGWAHPPKPPCSPVLTGGPEVDAVWRRLLVRSGARPGVPVTDDPDLHLLADGQRVDGVRQHAGVWAFHLPRRPREVRIMSRAGVPAELGHCRDPRALGVALCRIELRAGNRFRQVRAADARLAQGFHPFEQEGGQRWTDGNALLPDGLLHGLDGELAVVLHVGGTTSYPLLC